MPAKKLDQSEWVHGTPSTYQYHGCRCRPCTDAANIARKESRAKRNTRLGPDHPDTVHGRSATYADGCRCRDCRAAVDLKRKRTEETQLVTFDRSNPEDPLHGRFGYTVAKCKCDICARAGLDIRLFNLYGIRVGEYERQIESRLGVCDLCQNIFPKLVIDHDHQSGIIRGYICHGCNTGLGKLGDTIEGLQNAIRYLQNATGTLN